MHFVNAQMMLNLHAYGENPRHIGQCSTLVTG